jgi:hypothetical protein
VQPHAAEAFAAREKFDELISLLRKADRLYSDLAEQPGGAYLLRPGISVNGRDGKPVGHGGGQGGQPGGGQAVERNPIT